MMRGLVLACAVLIGTTLPAAALDANAPESCATGPVEKTFGGTPWLVASCSDGKSLVFVAKEGSPAAPFEFDLYHTGDGYDLTGKGAGNRKFTDAAYGEIRKLTGSAIRALVTETKRVKSE